MARKGRPRKRGNVEIKREYTPEEQSQFKHNTMFFSVNLRGKHPNVDRLVDILFSEMEEAGYLPIHKRYQEKLKLNLRYTVMNLYTASSADPNKDILYLRSGSSYGKGTKYQKKGLTYAYFIDKVIPFLEDNDYVTQRRTGYKFDNSSQPARIRATAKFMVLAEKRSFITPPMIERYIDDKDLIIMKDDKGKIVPRPPKRPDNYQKMIDNLKLINKVINDNIILLNISNEDLAYLNKRLNNKYDNDQSTGGAISFTENQLHRVFNRRAWDKGGRFVGGWWQRIINKDDDKRPGEKYRLDITINNYPTFEADYSGLHINMLYALKKLPCPDEDVYFIPGYSNDKTFRTFVKKLLLTMINSGSGRAGARRAMADAVKGVKRNEKGKIIAHVEPLTLPAEIKSCLKADLDPLIDEFEKKHEAVKDYFYSDMGIQLMYYDSLIVEAVMCYFANEHQTPCLPMHDSFIVAYPYRDELVHIMKTAFKKLMGQDIKVEPKGDTIGRDVKQGLSDWLDDQEKGNPPRDEWKEIKEINENYSVYYRLLKQFYETRPSIELWDEVGDTPEIPF